MIVAVIAGFLFVLAALIVPVPGPFSILLFFMGVTVLSWEFEFAQRIRNRLKSKASEIQANLQRRRKDKHG